VLAAAAAGLVGGGPFIIPLSFLTASVVGRVLKVAGWAIINRTCRQAFGAAHT
jgi:hypothetical protein